MKTQTIIQLLMLLLCFFTKGFSQSKITGIAQETNSEALPFANVLLLNPGDSSLVKGTISDESGKFLLENIQSGKYLLTITMVGYEQSYLQVNTSSSNLDLGILKINPLSKELKEITVVAKKPLYEQQFGKMVINIESSITLAGSTALDVLMRSPGVIVDQQNNSLGLNGKTGVVVLINGKFNRLPMDAVIQLLRGMNSANIEKIELITNPDAKYPAEGTAGIINIILKKNIEEGTNGSFSITGGYGRKEKSAANINLNHRKRKWNLYGDYSYDRNHTAQLIAGDRRVIYEGQSIETLTNNQRDPIILSHNARLGLDYQLSPKTVIGALISANSLKWKMDALADVRIFKSIEMDTSILMHTSEINHTRNLSGNLNLNHQFDSTQAINLDVDYIYQHNRNPTDYSAAFSDEQGVTLRNDLFKSGKITPLRIFVAKMDYSKNFGKKFKWESGLKANLNRFNNHIRIESLKRDEWLTDPSLSGDFTLKEDILAAYSSMSIELNPKTKLNAGLRYEHTRTHLSSLEESDILNRNYGNLFPSAFLSHEINKNNSFQFAYSRRITRPTFKDLAPFLIFLDPYSFVSGNAALLPALSHSLKAEYLYKDLIFALQYSHDTDVIFFAQPQIDPASNRSYAYPENIKSQDTYSLIISLPVEFTKWWTSQNNININHLTMVADYLEEPVSLEQFNFQIKTTQNIFLPKNFSFELSVLYNSPVYMGLNRWKAYGSVNLGLQKKFENNRGELSLNVSDLFWTDIWRFSTYIPEQNLDTNVKLVFSEPRVIKLTYSRNFGNNILKKSRSRSTGSEEEKRRVN